MWHFPTVMWTGGKKSIEEPEFLVPLNPSSPLAPVLASFSIFFLKKGTSFYIFWSGHKGHPPSSWVWINCSLTIQDGNLTPSPLLTWSKHEFLFYLFILSKPRVSNSEVSVHPHLHLISTSAVRKLQLSREYCSAQTSHFFLLFCQESVTSVSPTRCTWAFGRPSSINHIACWLSLGLLDHWEGLRKSVKV